MIAQQATNNTMQAAWGILQKQQTQLYIANYELGVLFINDTPATAPKWVANIPFKYDVDPYGAKEEPWMQEKFYKA